MSRRSICRGRIPWNGWAHIPWNSGARIALTRIGPIRISRARIDRRIPISRTLQPVPLRAALRGLPVDAGLVLGSVRLRPDGLRPCGLRPGGGRMRRRRLSGAGRGRATALAASPGCGKTQNRDRGSQRHSAHSSRIEFPGHNSLPAPGQKLGTANRRSGCWKASPTRPAVGRCCPAFADRGPRRPAPAAKSAGPSRLRPDTSRRRAAAQGSKP